MYTADRLEAARKALFAVYPDLHKAVQEELDHLKRELTHGGLDTLHLSTLFETARNSIIGHCMVPTMGDATDKLRLKELHFRLETMLQCPGDKQFEWIQLAIVLSTLVGGVAKYCAKPSSNAQDVLNAMGERLHTLYIEHVGLLTALHEAEHAERLVGKPLSR